MRSRWIVASLIVMLVLAEARPVSSQEVVNLTIDDLRFNEFPTVHIPVTVRNENGVPITGLGTDSFEIIEDGTYSTVPSQTEAQVNSDAVISVIMAIDISGSMEGKPITEAMRAANALLDQLSERDRGAIVAFADEVDIDPANLVEGKEIDFTTDKNALRNVVNFLDTKIGWDTPLYDAIYKSVRMVAQEPVGKRAVVVMTDGRDERDNAQGVPVKDAGSLSTPDDPINEANRHHIPVFSIGLAGIGGKIDTKYLRRLAERTGGTYQEAPEPEELTVLFENVIEQLKQQYTLSYNSALTEDDREHSVVVRVVLPQGQAFNETKFRFRPAAAPTPEPAATEPATPTTVAQVTEVVEPLDNPVAEPVAQEDEGFIQKIRDMIEDNPMLAVVIGVGALLLLALIVALVVVLVQGRRSKEGEDYLGAELEDFYPTGSDEMPEPVSAGVAEVGTEVEERTEFAPADWPDVGVGMPPVAPPFGVPSGHGVPPAGQTRVIERAQRPKRLAMLVDRAHPERKYDLTDMMNVGRSQDNQIVLQHPTVSRHHAWVRMEGEAYLVFDVGSANGTFVNDERVTDPRPLADGDIVKFGDTEFIFKKVL